MEISTESLFDIVQTEKKDNELQPLPENFFEAVRSKLSEPSLDPSESRNIRKLADTLKAKRIQKLLIYLAYNKQLPEPIPKEEEELYMKIKNAISSEGGQQVTKVRITADVPELITQKGNKLGPYKQNQVIEITDKESIDFLLVNKIGEIIT